MVDISFFICKFADSKKNNNQVLTRDHCLSKDEIKTLIHRRSHN